MGLARLVASACETFAPVSERKGVALRVDWAALRVDVLADPARMQQVLGNLVGNAVKFTPPGGSIAIDAALVGGQVQLRVTDSGIGIAPDELPKVFDRFFRSSSSLSRAVPGTGLGLAIAEALVEAHGGELAVQSTVGEGSTFTVSLPLTHDPAWLASSPSTTTPSS